MKSVLLVLTSSYLASCMPPPHPAVLAVSREEDLLPFHLRKPAIWNPHLQQILPITSLLHEGESPVFERATDSVSRQEIYNILTHAGFLPRRHPYHQPDPNHKEHHRIKVDQKVHHQGYQFYSNSDLQSGDPYHHSIHSPYLGNPEFLQYL